MLTVIFVITTVVFGIKWIIRYISSAALIYYIQKKGYKLPDDDELKECTQFVIKNMLNDKDKKRGRNR